MTRCSWSGRAGGWLQAFLDLILPPCCPGCGKEVGVQGAWCPLCLNALWKPRLLDVSARGMRHVESCRVLAGYGGTVRTLIHGLKFQKRRENAAFLKFLVSLADETELAGLPLPDGIAVPVPLSLERKAERGYNQVELLFADWCVAMDIRWESDYLSRIRSTLPQWELGRAERAENLKGAFFVNAPALVQNQTILLLDDIVTTGQTFEACAKVLRKAGASAVHALAIAHG